MGSEAGVRARADEAEAPEPPVVDVVDGLHPARGGQSGGVTAARLLADEHLPGADLDRVFMIMGYLFCLSNVFVLSKMVRDNQKARQGGRADTPMFRYVVWSGFLLAMALTPWAVRRLKARQTRELIAKRGS